MLIHLTPRMFACRTTEPCTLIDLTCDELGLDLKGDKDLIARRPYPNKNYLVACRRVGQKAIDGILIESPRFVRDFTVVTRWAVLGQYVATHRVRYVVQDDEFDAVSDKMLCWHSTKRRSPLPQLSAGSTPANTQPRMDVTQHPGRLGNVTDVVDDQGFVIERNEIFQVPTMERERVLNPKYAFNDRVPQIESVFVAGEPRNSGVSNRVMILDLSGDHPYMTEVEDLLGGVGRVIFPDGTEQFVDDYSEPWGLYSPRLRPEALEQFCKENIAHYQAFHEAHESQLIRCESVPMERFWESKEVDS
ncbi:DUF6012 family protein [Pseudomonas chlororaphis]|uniref:DUF6012 family protein n=1 Tax=Pseudomonas chlororaphis TaxID=587753 RepID=UPI002D76F201|nr:DUF6012 family protein [Pseudomonas chlororaphis]